MKNYIKTIAFVVVLFFKTQHQTQAQTYFHGGIYANTTWTLANSPYIITDTVVVFPGDTLTIQPGVVVKFDSTVYMEIRQATLIANGTSAQPITFQANSTNAGRTFWNNININNPDTLVLNYCNVKNSTGGIVISWNKKWNLVFKHLNFNNNYEGISFYGTNTSTPNGIIDSSVFNYNTNPIYSSFCLCITNSNFNNNFISLYGFRYCQATKCIFSNEYSVFAYSADNTIISNCIFKKNQNVFDNFLNNFYFNSGNVNGYAVYNSIFSNNQNVCHEYNYINNSYSGYFNCTIDSNNIGIQCINSIINSCSFKNNHVAIIEQYSTIKKSVIENNGVGIEALNGLDSIYCNRIANDSFYNFKYSIPYYNSTNTNAHIGSNDWGTRNDSLIHTKIYDGYTNISLGLVNFLPIDTSQCYLSSCHLVLTPNVTNATCDTCHNGSIAVVASGGGAPYHYTWYTTPLQTAATVSSLAPGKYHFCVADVRGCGACDTVFVDSFNCAKFKTTATTVSASCATCHNGKATILHSSSNAPYQFVWNTSPAQYTDSAIGLHYGHYIGCVTDHNNCQSCDTVLIDSTRCKNFAVQLTSTAVSCKTCNDGKAFSQVTAGTAPYVYSWNTIPVGTADSITHQHWGMFTLQVTDANSCAATHSVFIDSVNCTGFVIYTFADSVSCNTCNNGKAYVHAQGGVLPYSYHWNTLPINLSDTIKHQHQGVYQVCVKDNQGCQLCQNVWIDSFNCGNMQVKAHGKNTTCGTCANGAAWAVATGGATPYSYWWNTTQTTDSIKNITIGKYQVAATDGHGCQSLDSIQIDSTICFGFQVAAHQINPTCNTCTNGSAWVNATGGAAPYHYTWYTSPLQSSASVSNLLPNTYRVFVSDANTCAVCDTLDLTKTCSAQFQLFADTTQLHHYIAVNMASGILPLHYSWSWGDGSANDTARYPNHVYAQAGFYTLCLTIVDAVNCTNNYCDSFYLMRSKNAMVSISVVPAKHAATGIEQLTNNQEQLSIYPNPTNSELRIRNEALRIDKVEIENVLGQVVLHPFISSSSNLLVDVSSLPSGIYFLKATTNNGKVMNAKFVKE